MVFRIKLLLTACLLLPLLGACAGMPADRGQADVARLNAERGRGVPQVPDADAFTAQALQTPLSIDTAVQLALINNPDVRVQGARLGIAAAEVYEAGRLANPVFSLSRLSAGEAANPQLTLGIAFNFVNLLFMPANRRHADAQFETLKLSVAGAAFDLATDVEIAWYEAAGAEQIAQMREAASRAARASADLAARFFQAGNINTRALAMEQAAASQATLAALSAQADAAEARSHLNRLMGLDAARNTWSFDAQLAEPPAQDAAAIDLQRLSLDSRLDVLSLQRHAQALAARHGRVRRTRLIEGLELGAERERDFDGSLHAGPTLALELPLFNWGGGRNAAIQASLDQAEAELDARVLDVSNAVQLGAAKLALARTAAEQYRDVLVPQRERIVAEAQKEQNFMLIGVFDLILARQESYDAYAGYIASVRDYWSARARLSRAVGRTLPMPASQDAKPIRVDTPASEDAGGHHAHPHHGDAAQTGGHP